MQVVIISTGFNRGGAEKIVSDKLKHFLTKGYIIHLILLMNTEKEYDLPSSDNLKIIRLGIKKNLASIIRGLIRAHLYLYSLNDKYIIFSHMVHANIFSCLLKVIDSSRYIVCVAHNTIEASGLLLKFYIFLSRLVDRFIQVSDEGAEKYLSMGFHNGIIEVIRNGVDVNQFPYFPISSIEKDDMIKLVAVGRLTTQKNYPMLIDAINLLRGKGLKLELSIYGEGPLRERLEQMIQAYKLSNVISLMGFSNEYNCIYGDRHIFILSSNYEGFGLVLAEAMLSGLICISTDCGGVREVGSQFVSYIPKDDPIALANSIETVCSRSFGELQTTSLSGREWIKSNFSISDMLMKYEDILHDVQLATIS